MNKFTGIYQLINRLIYQFGSEAMAYKILTERGDYKDGKLTAQGERRNAMTAEERALDRTSRATHHKISDLKYNPQTNRATLKK